MPADGREERMSEDAMSYRLRITFQKTGFATFINHMDLPTIFSRAARRAGLKQEFTQGFSPHPKISLCPPLAVGVEGLCEPAEFWFEEWNDDAKASWNACLPEGLTILNTALVEGQSLAKCTTAAIYKIYGFDDFKLSDEAFSVLQEEVKKSAVLFDSSFVEGEIMLAVGSLDNCGAGSLVKALRENGICGWSDLYILRSVVGFWDAEASSVVPLI